MIDFLTSAVLGGIAYDFIKVSGKIAVDDLKARLKNWLLDDRDLETIAQIVNEAPSYAKKSAKDLEAFLEKRPSIQEILSRSKSVTINAGDRITTKGDYSPGKVVGDFIIYKSTKIIHEALKPEFSKKKTHSYRILGFEDITLPGIDGANLRFRVETIPSDKINTPEEKSVTTPMTITVSYSNTLAADTTWSNRKNEQDLQKILYEYVKRFVEQKLMIEEIGGTFELNLDQIYHKSKEPCPYDPAKIVLDYNEWHEVGSV